MHICPRCGTKEGSKPFIGPFCIDCYEFKIEMPNKIVIDQCKRCLKVKLHGVWVNFSEKKITDYVKKKFKGEFDSAEFFPSECRAVFTIIREGRTMEIPKQVNFEMLGGICTECNKKAGGYFEAIIQLRGNQGQIWKYSRIFEKRLADKETFISKAEEGKDGLDLYVGSTRAVLSVIKELGLTYKISTKLAGQKQGKRLYRTSFAIRFD